ncbi:MAG: DUF423 domain-containing protein [Burkholderiaceae bacterium]|nr:DUF423 domain-containing protein [Burkholderiaceae bacterium]
MRGERGAIVGEPTAAERTFLFLGALSALLAVGAGAAGAHVAPTYLAPPALELYDIAVHYQMLHAIALCIAAYACERTEGSRVAIAAGVLFVAGTLLFCGALYLHALAGLRQAARLAPFGGVSFIAGWACLAWAALRAGRTPRSRTTGTRSPR